MKAFACFTALSLALSSWSGALPREMLALPGAGVPPDRPFTVECRMVTLPITTALPLIPDLSDETKAAGAYAKLQALVFGGQATLQAALYGQGVERRSVVAESVQELTYGSEYQPPQLPESSTEHPLTVEILKNWPIVGVTPTAFEKRKVGQMLTVEVTGTADPKVVVCTFEAHHVRLERYFQFDAGRLANGERLYVEQPFFSELKDTSQAVLESGQPKLIGVHVLPGPEGLVELFVLTLTLHALSTP